MSVVAPEADYGRRMAVRDTIDCCFELLSWTSVAINYSMPDKRYALAVQRGLGALGTHSVLSLAHSRQTRPSVTAPASSVRDRTPILR